MKSCCKTVTAASEKSISPAAIVNVQPTPPAGFTVVVFAPAVKPVPTISSDTPVTPPVAFTAVTLAIAPLASIVSKSSI